MYISEEFRESITQSFFNDSSKEDQIIINKE